MSDRSPLPSPSGTLTLSFQAGGDPAIWREMDTWVKGLEDGSAGRITVVSAPQEASVHLPSLTICGAGTSRISYHFVPESLEADAFQELLRRRMEMRPGKETGSEEDESPSEPLEVLLFVANECPNCPRMVRAVHALAMDPAPPHLHVHVFDATLSEELAGRHHVKSVPTLLIQDRFRFVGPLDPAKLASLLRSGDAGMMVEEQIRNQIRWGEAPQAGRKIAEIPAPAFLIRDLEHATFQERVGWLLALEEALESRPGCLDPLVPELARLAERAEPALRGDLAALLGTIGSPDALPALERLRQDPNPDVAEAAEEAMEQILEKAR